MRRRSSPGARHQFEHKSYAQISLSYFAAPSDRQDNNFNINPLVVSKMKTSTSGKQIIPHVNVSLFKGKQKESRVET